jgi:hypothetical protein
MSKSNKITTAPAWRTLVIPSLIARANRLVSGPASFGHDLRLRCRRELPSYVGGAPIPTQPVIDIEKQSIYLSRM